MFRTLQGQERSHCCQKRCVIPERKALVKDSACRWGSVNFLEISVTEERVTILQNAAPPAHRASTIKLWLLGLRRSAKMGHAVTHIVGITGELSNWQKLGVYPKKQVSVPARSNGRTAVIGLTFFFLELRQAHRDTLTRRLSLSENLKSM